MVKEIKNKPCKKKNLLKYEKLEKVTNLLNKYNGSSDTHSLFTKYLPAITIYHFPPNLKRTYYFFLARLRAQPGCRRQSEGFPPPLSIMIRRACSSQCTCAPKILLHEPERHYESVLPVDKEA